MSNKYTVAAVGNCPTIEQLDAAFTAWGLPSDKVYGLIDVTHDKECVKATLCIRGTVRVKNVDDETKSIEITEVPKTSLIEFRISPRTGTPVGLLEAFSGRVALKHITKMLAAVYEMDEAGAYIPANAEAIVIEQIPIDIVDFFQNLQSANHERGGSLMVSAKVSRHEIEGKMHGAFSPKFDNSPEGVEYVIEHQKLIKSVDASFTFTKGKSKITIPTEASFTYSCDEGDVISIQTMLEDMTKLPARVGYVGSDDEDVVTPAVVETVSTDVVGGEL